MINIFLKFILFITTPPPKITLSGSVVFIKDPINDAKDLAREIEKLLFKFDDAEKMAKAGIIIAKSHHGILDYVLETLEPFLNKIEAIRR